MKNNVGLGRIIAFLIFSVFLYTSCPQPSSSPNQKETVIKTYVSYIDENGDSSEEETEREVFWAEKDGELVKAKVLIQKFQFDTFVTIVNEENETSIQFNYYDGACFPHSLELHSKDEKGLDCTVLGEFSAYDESTESFSVTFYDEGKTSTETLENIKLNKRIWEWYKNLGFSSRANYIKEFLREISLAITYTIGVSLEAEETSSPSSSFMAPSYSLFGKFFKKIVKAVCCAVAIVAIVACVILNPAAITATGIALTTGTAPYLITAAASILGAFLTDKIKEPSVYGETTTSDDQAVVPRVYMWQVDRQGVPSIKPNDVDYFSNDSLVHLHPKTETETQDAVAVYFKVQIINNVYPLSVVFDSVCNGTTKVDAFSDAECTQSILNSDTKKINTTSDSFYLKLNSSGFSYPEKEGYILLLFSGEYAVNFNGSDSSINLKLEGKEEQAYNNVFKINVCTTKQTCEDD